MKHANAARSALHAFAHNMYRRNEKVLKKKVLKQNNLLRLQKRLAVVMLALTLGLGTGCGKTDDGADDAASSEAETLADGQTNDQTNAGAEEENGQESKRIMTSLMQREHIPVMHTMWQNLRQSLVRRTTKRVIAVCITRYLSGHLPIQTVMV